MRKLSWLLILSLFIISCEKDDDTQVDSMTVLINSSGTLTVKIMQNTVTPCNGALVYIYSDSSEGDVIFHDTTNSDGTLNVGKLLEGHYECYVRAEKNNIFYGDRKSFQIISGDTKTIEINPFLNVGTISVKIIDQGSYIIPNVNVALIPFHSYSYEDYEFDELMEAAYYFEVTDSEGWVTFENVPAGSPYSYDYSIMAFYDSETYSYPNQGNSLYTTRNVERQFTVQVDF